MRRRKGPDRRRLTGIYATRSPSIPTCATTSAIPYRASPCNVGAHGGAALQAAEAVATKILKVQLESGRRRARGPSGAPSRKLSGSPFRYPLLDQVGTKVQTSGVGTRSFSVKEAAKITRVPRSSVNFWSGRAKVLMPEVAYAGRGSRKLFSERNLVQIRLVHLLTQRWIPLKTVRALVKKLHWFDPRDHVWGPAEIVVCRGNTDWQLRSTGVTEEGQPTALLEALWKDVTAHEDLLVVNLAKVKRDILKEI
jgi:DNA-binding transcriptional MerR regulator